VDLMWLWLCVSWKYRRIGWKSRSHKTWHRHKLSRRWMPVISRQYWAVHEARGYESRGALLCEWYALVI